MTTALALTKGSGCCSTSPAVRYWRTLDDLVRVSWRNSTLTRGRGGAAALHHRREADQADFLLGARHRLPMTLVFAPYRHALLHRRHQQLAYGGSTSTVLAPSAPARVDLARVLILSVLTPVSLSVSRIDSV